MSIFNRKSFSEKLITYMESKRFEKDDKKYYYFIKNKEGLK